MAHISDPIDMEAFENTVHQWFSQASGLQTEWENQSAPQLPRPYGSLSITAGPRAVSHSWEHQEIDSGINERGKEILVVDVVQASITVSCKVHVGRPDSRNPTYNALNYINRAEGGLHTETYHSLFRTGNIAFQNIVLKDNIPNITGAAYKSAAVLDVMFGCILKVEELTGYIATVEVTGTVDETLTVEETVNLEV